MKISAELEKTDASAFSLVAAQKEKQKQAIASQVVQLATKDNSVLPRELMTETLFLLLEGATISSTIQKNIQPLKQARKAAAKLL